MTVLVSFSFRKIGAINATQSGEVLTRTTELVMVVYSRDVIQVAKCTARKIPESSPSKSSLRVSWRNSSRCRIRAGGARNKLASNRREAAITREGASSCANRIKTDDVETARIAIVIADSRRRLDGFSIDNECSFEWFPPILTKKEPFSAFEKRTPLKLPRYFSRSVNWDRYPQPRHSFRPASF